MIITSDGIAAAVADLEHELCGAAYWKLRDLPGRRVEVSGEMYVVRDWVLEANGTLRVMIEPLYPTHVDLTITAG